jgi:phospholipid-binding lipoprotein MlaA
VPAAPSTTTAFWRRLAWLSLIAAPLIGGVSGCAKAPPASDPDALADFKQTNDPLEPTNRVFYAINNGLDTVLLRPLAVGYRYVFPQFVRNGVHNFLTNLGSPVALADDMMQGKPRRAGDTLMRGVINTTVGIGGLFDVATDWGYPAHDTDFGLTMAIWGIPNGPFLFLPVLGPSNPRDAVGFGGDIALDPLTWVGRGYLVSDAGLARFGVTAIDARSRHIEDIDKLKETALDPYATFRSLYRQHRAAQIEETRDDDRSTIPVWFPDRAGPSEPSASTPAPPIGLASAPRAQ